MNNPSFFHILLLALIDLVRSGSSCHRDVMEHSMHSPFVGIVPIGKHFRDRRSLFAYTLTFGKVNTVCYVSEIWMQRCDVTDFEGVVLRRRRWTYRVSPQSRSIKQR